ncbi:MAG: NUDIX domain-containing protein [Candidatus Shapirobacteria bacterium]
MKIDKALKTKDNLSYREGVIGIIIDQDNNYLIVQGSSYSYKDWKFPSGGIKNNETSKKALLRELKEELGTDQFKIIKKSKMVNKFPWPQKVVANTLQRLGKTWKGQEQDQYLVRFAGNKNEIKINPREIKKIKWIKKAEFKKHFNFPGQYKLVLKTLKDLQ